MGYIVTLNLCPCNRCTKNSFMYRDPVTALWTRIPWDMEDVFPSDYRSGWDTCDRCIMMDLGMGGIESMHPTDVESPSPPPRLCMSIHTLVQPCSDLGRVFVLDDPSAWEQRREQGHGRSAPHAVGRRARPTWQGGD